MDEKPKFDIERYAVFVPMAYLVLTAAIAILGNLLGLPKEVLGILIGAGVTRIKMPVKPKA
jgi:hypothetical protein